MDFPFFNRPALKKITVAGAADLAEPARTAVAGIVGELPDVLMTYVADVASGTVLAAYTSHRGYNPHQISLRNARIFSLLTATTNANPWLGGPVQDLTIMLEDQYHYLRLCRGGRWYCFAAVLTAEANLGIVKDIVRRHVA